MLQAIAPSHLLQGGIGVVPPPRYLSPVYVEAVYRLDYQELPGATGSFLRAICRPEPTFDGTPSQTSVTHTRTGVPDGGSGFDGGKHHTHAHRSPGRGERFRWWQADPNHDRGVLELLAAVSADGPVTPPAPHRHGTKKNPPPREQRGGVACPATGWRSRTRRAGPSATGRCRRWGHPRRCLPARSASSPGTGRHRRGCRPAA